MAWVSNGAKGTWHRYNFWAVMSGGFWQFYYITLFFTLEFWVFISDWHPLFQIPNSSPASNYLSLVQQLCVSSFFKKFLYTCLALTILLLWYVSFSWAKSTTSARVYHIELLTYPKIKGFSNKIIFEDFHNFPQKQLSRAMVHAVVHDLL